MTRPALTLDLFVAFPSYGGNGGVAAEHPDIRGWWSELYPKLLQDPRIGRVVTRDYNDTPITMIRNRMVVDARRAGCHLLLMVDSDQSPNKHAGEPWFKPFWDAAFPEVYDHYGKGPLVVGAPYCGPPHAGENVYVFCWEADGNRGDATPIRLAQYSRSTARKMRGVQEAAALPTGLILYDMRAFELIEPSGLTAERVIEKLLLRQLTPLEALCALQSGWFSYEWKDGYASEKASTEDVQNTRDISLAGQAKLGYNPLRVAWDSWIGHWKPWNVGKPESYDVSHIAATFRRVCAENVSPDSAIVDLSKMWAGVESRPKPVIATIQDWRTAHVMPTAHVTAIVQAVQRSEQHRGNYQHQYLEVGVWLGDTFHAVLATCRDTSCVAVDTFAGSGADDHVGALAAQASPEEVRDEFLRRMPEDCRSRAEVNMMPLEERWNCRASDSFDIIFVDAAHDYGSVVRHLNIARKIVRTGGAIIVHDFDTDQFPDVTRACLDVFPDITKRILHVDDAGAILLVSNSKTWKHLPEFTPSPPEADAA